MDDLKSSVVIKSKEAIAVFKDKNNKFHHAYRYAYSKYSKDIAIELANYSALFDERMNNYIVFVGNFVEIYLYDKKDTTIRKCIIERADYNLVKGYYWRIEYGDNRLYVITSAGSKVNNQSDLRMHKLIMNCPEDMVVDHKDGNGLNNTRKNMRIVTNKENSRNRKLNINSSTGFKNVRSTLPNRDGFEVVVYDENGKKHTKYFATSICGNRENALLEAAIYAEEKQIEFNYLHKRYEMEQKLYNVLFNIKNKKK